jgi:hypothetical protein
VIQAMIAPEWDQLFARVASGISHDNSQIRPGFDFAAIDSRQKVLIPPAARSLA